MKRTMFFGGWSFVVWATLFGLLAAACGSGVGAGGAAIEFGDISLPRSEVNDFASAFATLGAPEGTEPATPNPAGIAQSLEFFAASAAIETSMADEITAEHRTTGDMWAASEFPQVGQDTALFARLAGYWASRAAIPEGALRERLDEVNAEAGQQVCASHILVASEAEATDLISQIEGGAEFGALAAEFSTDVGSGAQGGSLGCVPQGQYVPTFEAAVWAGAEGDLIGPVESEFGFHIISHEGFIDGGFVFEEVAEDLREAVLNERIGDAIIGANVQVDPRYGSWDQDNGVIVLPEGAETEGGDLEIPVVGE